MNDKQDQALRDLYQKSRQEQPPEALDQRIRKAAERRIYRSRKRWIWGLSTAAVLVLSFNIVLNLVYIEPASKGIVTLDESHFQPLPSARLKTEKEQSPDSEKNLPRSMPSAPATAVSQADTPVVLEPQKLSKKSKPGMLSTPQPSAEAVQEERPDSGLLSAGKTVPSISIPQLPYQLDELLQFDAGLSGDTSASGLITVYFDNKLILTLASIDNVHVFKAWPGAQKLGVKVDWNVKPSQLDQCDHQNVYIACSLNERVQGLFEQDRLDHISWKVTHE